MSRTLAIPRFHLTRGALGAFAVALALHGAWWFLLARYWHPAGSARPLPEAPRLAYLPDARETGEARAFGSPVLFALPTELGFSGGDRLSLDRAPAGLKGMGASPVLQGRPPAENTADGYLPGLEQLVNRTAPVAPVAGEPERAFSLAVGATGFALRIYWPDGTPPVRSGLPGAGVLAALLKDKPWELEALLEFDPQGGVRHVLIEKPTPERERNELVARALRAIRIEGGQASRARVVVQYDQDAVPRTAGSEAVRR